jgi:hypothetical protein
LHIKQGGVYKHYMHVIMGYCTQTENFDDEEIEIILFVIKLSCLLGFGIYLQKKYPKYEADLEVVSFSSQNGHVNESFYCK